MRVRRVEELVASTPAWIPVMSRLTQILRLVDAGHRRLDRRVSISSRNTTAAGPHQSMSLDRRRDGGGDCEHHRKFLEVQSGRELLLASFGFALASLRLRRDFPCGRLGPVAALPTTFSTLPVAFVAAGFDLEAVSPSFWFRQKCGPNCRRSSAWNLSVRSVRSSQQSFRWRPSHGTAWRK